MKYLLIIFDGMADEPLEELDGKTPMQVAKKPYMDDLASRSLIGAARTAPEGMYPSSDITNMGILGYDPREYYTGRGAIEAASLEIPIDTTDAVFRANLVSTDGELMVDSTAGHISTEEARELITLIDEKLHTNVIRFYPGVSYRHIMVWRGGSDNVRCTPPYKFHGKPFREFYPEGNGAEKLIRMMEDSYEILDGHPINRRRRDEGHLPANMIWFWGESHLPEIPSFFNKFGVTGAVVAAVDLIRGLGRMVGLKVIDVPGATGYIDTNYLGKGQYAVRALAQYDFVWVHVEAPDEAGHESDIDKKIEAIQECDQKVLGTILDGVKKLEQDVRILLMPDHPTPISTGSHSSDMVPFLLFDSTQPKQTNLPFDERAVHETKLVVDHAPNLMRMLLKLAES
ncbi:MAG: cofactor-independent phosphoglycerate mutase [Armatimonadetes bacterium]|nr:cofactor-independent phosphoglycerate mutase [Armatimonadota bacterium]